ncbi:unnamed protein product, partial [Meganyctiphanes norvegica]
MLSKVLLNIVFLYLFSVFSRRDRILFPGESNPQLSQNETYIINAGDPLLLECKGKKNVTWSTPNQNADTEEDQYFTEDLNCSTSVVWRHCSTFKIDEAIPQDTGEYICEHQADRNSYDMTMVYVHDT